MASIARVWKAWKGIGTSLMEPVARNVLRG
uniref:Uncharacterized protein n=1 Tax=Rhizophora mucronata TaxID=61149 RepID=A0A2P2IZF4_RHIMU